MQPSELAKPALVIFLAFFVTWRARAINNPRYTLVPAALAVGLVILAVVVADLGTAVVLGAAATVVFFVAGLEWRYCFIVAGGGAGGPGGFHLPRALPAGARRAVCRPGFQDHRQIDPQGHLGSACRQSLATRDTNYQLEQSKIAVGAGGVVGRRA